LRKALNIVGGRPIVGSEGEITPVVWSPNDHWVVTGSPDGTARLWDLRVKDPSANPVVLRAQGEVVDVVTISPDSHWLVTTGSKDVTARLWDLSAKDPSANSVVLRSQGEVVHAVTISPDNRWLVTGCGDGTAQLWDLSAKDPSADPEILHSDKNHSVWKVAISPDNHWLVTVSDNATMRLWLFSVNDLIDSARAIAGRNFTADEWKLYFPGESYHKTFRDLPGP
jgi:protease II